MLEFAVLADDLTGGMIIASSLEHEGVRCPLVTSIAALADLPPATEAVVLARKIRLVEPDLAREEARQAAAAFEALGAKRIFSKYSALFDSTARGNIGPIAETLLEATGASRTIFCPSFVERDVTVYEGRMFLRGTPLGESFKRFDPATPMLDSNLVEVLQAQSGLKVGLLRRRHSSAGKAAAEAALARQAGARLFIADAIDAGDIERLAELTLDWPLTTGADSLPPALARLWRRGRPPARGSGRRLLPPAPGFEAVLAGSCAAPTLMQLEAFERAHPVWRIDLVRDGEDPDLLSRISAWASPRLKSGPVAIATSADQAGVEAAQQRHGREGAAALSDRFLGALAQRLLDLGVRKFVVAGGESSGQVVSALGIRRVEVARLDDMQGGYCHQAEPVAVSLVLKPGTFGDAEFLFSALARLREADGADRANPVGESP
jgi:uncharacterized protein YgbK (DUF1537 family)